MSEPQNGYKRYCLSITGENSHVFDLQIGQGSLSIGTKGISEGKYDIWVEPSIPINWDAFNNCYTGYGAEHKEDIPYGDWPRWIYYSGNDTGFIEWTKKRRAEGFNWIPCEDVDVNLENASIDQLGLDLKKHIRITVDKTIRSIIMTGDPRNADVKAKGKMPQLTFVLKDFYAIPDFEALHNVEHIGIEISPLEDAFDCESLLQFKHLKHLNLRGNICNAASLAELHELQSIGLRYIPDLDGFPDLGSWKDLKSFIGWNIEENAGKRLRKQLKALEKEREFEWSSVSQLRSKTWFATEYDNPFKEWDGPLGKKASKIYKDYLKEIKKSTDEDVVRESIIRFSKVFNEFGDLDTVQREFVADAVGRLVIASPIDIDRDTWLEWFDSVRDY